MHLKLKLLRKNMAHVLILKLATISGIAFKKQNTSCISVFVGCVQVLPLGRGWEASGRCGRAPSQALVHGCVTEAPPYWLTNPVTTGSCWSITEVLVGRGRGRGSGLWWGELHTWAWHIWAPSGWVLRVLGVLRQEGGVFLLPQRQEAGLRPQSGEEGTPCVAPFPRPTAHSAQTAGS